MCMCSRQASAVHPPSSPQARAEAGPLARSYFFSRDTIVVDLGMAAAGDGLT